MISVTSIAAPPLVTGKTIIEENLLRLRLKTTQLANAGSQNAIRFQSLAAWSMQSVHGSSGLLARIHFLDKGFAASGVLVRALHVHRSAGIVEYHGVALAVVDQAGFQVVAFKEECHKL